MKTKLSETCLSGFTAHIFASYLFTRRGKIRSRSPAIFFPKVTAYLVSTLIIVLWSSKNASFSKIKKTRAFLIKSEIYR